MQRTIEMVDADGRPVKFDLFGFLKKVNGSIEFKDDGRIIVHIPPKPESPEKEGEPVFCICGYDPKTGCRTDILCPVHDKHSPIMKGK